MRFAAKVQYWKGTGGLAVAYVPKEQIESLGGLKQKRVSGKINGRAFTSSVWPAGQGRLALNVTKAMMKAADVSVGQSAKFDVAKP